MTTEPMAEADRRHRRCWRRFAGIVALFAVLGPLVGIVIVAPLGLGDLLEFVRFMPSGSLKGLIFVVVVGIYMAFACGWLQGILVGLAMALWYRRTGTVPLVLAALCGLVALAVPLGLGLPDFGGKDPLRVETPAEYAFVIAAHLLAAIACAALARRLFVPVRLSVDIRG